MSSTLSSHSCALCGAAATAHCGSCKSVYYCSKDHQKSDWKIHKSVCRGKTERGLMSVLTASASGPGSPSAWTAGLSESWRYEWLIDCYRLYCDSQATSNGEMHGAYAALTDPSNQLDLVADFLLFCKLAVRRHVIPSPKQSSPNTVWNWKKFLNKASELLPCIVERSDLRERYGKIDSAEMSGFRCFKQVEETVYGGSVQDYMLSSNCEETKEEQENDEVRREVNRSLLIDDHGEDYDDYDNDNDNDDDVDDGDEGDDDRAILIKSMEKHSEVFTEVGGVELWKQLVDKLVDEENYDDLEDDLQS